MEALLFLLPLAFTIYVFVGAVRGNRAANRMREVERRIDRLSDEIGHLRRALSNGTGPASQDEARTALRPYAPAAAAESSAPTSPPAAASETPPANAQLAAESAPPPPPAPAAWSPPQQQPFAVPEPQESTAFEPVASEPPRRRPAARTKASDALWPEPEQEPASASESPPPAETDPSSRPAAEPAREPAAAFVGVEEAVGLRWLTWVGIGLLFLGVAFFLKYAYDRDWLGRFFGPRLRIATAAAAAGTLVVLGWRSLKNGMQALGQGLLGGGQALAYLTIFAAYQPAMFVVDEPLLSSTATFALMAVVTAIGLVLAVRLDAIAMAFLAVLGGFAAPALIRTGNDSRDALCTYMLLLDLGVLFVASRRRWRALDLLALTGTCVLFAGWWLGYGDRHPQPDATLVWVLVFHLLFAVLPFVPHWRDGTKVALERFLLAVANLAATLVFLGTTLRTAAPNLLAACCLVGAPMYLGLGFATAKRVGADARTRDGFLALAVLLWTLGLFYLLPGANVATAWFVESVVLVWLGFRFAHQPTRVLGLVLFCVAFARNWLRFSEVADPANALVWNGRFLSLATASIAGFCIAWLERSRAQKDDDRRVARVLGIASGWWLLGVGAEEVVRHAGVHPEAWADPRSALVVAWLLTAGALAFLVAAVRLRSLPTLVAGSAPLLGAAIAVANAYVSYPADAWPVWNGSCLAGLGALAVLFAFGWFAPRAGVATAQRAQWFGTAQLALAVLATIETAAYVQRGIAAPTANALASALGWVWLGTGGLGVAFAASLPSRRVLVLALLPLVASAAVPFVLYESTLPPHVLVVNARFLFTAATCAAIALLRGPLQRVGLGGRDVVGAAAYLTTVGWSSVEVMAHSFAEGAGAVAFQWAVWWLGVVFVLSSLGGTWRSRVTANAPLRTVARAVTFVAAPLPLLIYVSDLGVEWMFFNLRFLLLVGAVVAVLAARRQEPRVPAFGPLAVVVGLLGLTFEPARWFLQHVAEQEEAVRLANFSITVTWIVCAVVLLGTGFRFQRRALRLSALALFALTAGKLLAYDMSGAQQLYRILAFVLVGIVFVAASWIYHRVERRMAKAQPQPQPPSPPQQPEPD